MDLSKGYWQVGLTERSKPLTAFETPTGLFQFRTMPFGLVNSGATFCRLMRIILSYLPNVDSFVDDMWIFTETWKDHMTSLRQVLDRLRSAKLTAKTFKCMIGYDSIECLGHNILGQTVRPQRTRYWPFVMLLARLPKGKLNLFSVWVVFTVVLFPTFRP